MTRNEQIRELLEKVSANLWDYTSPNVAVKNERLSSDKNDIDQALALLKDQPCSTCGGSGESKKGNWYCYRCDKKVMSAEIVEKCHNVCGCPVVWKSTPCPDCPEKK